MGVTTFVICLPAGCDLNMMNMIWGLFADLSDSMYEETFLPEAAKVYSAFRLFGYFLVIHLNKIVKMVQSVFMHVLHVVFIVIFRTSGISADLFSL